MFLHHLIHLSLMRRVSYSQHALVLIVIRTTCRRVALTLEFWEASQKYTQPLKLWEASQNYTQPFEFWEASQKYTQPPCVGRLLLFTRLNKFFKYPSHHHY